MGRFRYGRVRKAGSDIGPDQIRPDQRGPIEILDESDRARSGRMETYGAGSDKTGSVWVGSDMVGLERLVQILGRMR